MCRTNIICISCPKGCQITVESMNGKIKGIFGCDCSAGKEYAEEEFENPSRILTTTVRIKNAFLPLLSVKTSAPIPKDILMDAMKEIAKIEVEASINISDIIIENFMETGIDVVATRSINKVK
ncbi:DUF1667 domain-containing protein [Natronospora cellulosivora (SeqCode)]